MNFYIGCRTTSSLPAAQLVAVAARLKALQVGFAALNETTVALLNPLEAWNPPTDSYVQGCLLRRDDFPRVAFERHHQRAEVRAVLTEGGLSGLLARAELFIASGKIDYTQNPPRLVDDPWEQQHPEWSLVVGFSTSAKSVLAQKKVQEGLRTAGFVDAEYAGIRRVFGACVATVRCGDGVRDVELESQLPKIGEAMQAFLAGAGKKLTPPGRAPDAVEAFLCWNVVRL